MTAEAERVDPDEYAPYGDDEPRREPGANAYLYPYSYPFPKRDELTRYPEDGTVLHRQDRLANLAGDAVRLAARRRRAALKQYHQALHDPANRLAFSDRRVCHAAEVNGYV